MKVRLDALATKLAASLAPIYIVSGDEPLLVQETVAAIELAAAKRGFGERLSLVPSTAADWQDFLSTSRNLSLFSDQQRLLLHLPSLKIGDAGSRALQAYATHPPQDKCLIVITSKVDKKTESLKWYQALEQAGMAIAIWPIARHELARWIQQRCQQQGLQATMPIAQLLADKVEGNLIAAHQEIEKLRLCMGEGELTLAALEGVVTGLNQFTLFDLVDAIHAGACPRVVKILLQLQASHMELPLVLWALARELRDLNTLAYAHHQGGQAVISKRWPAQEASLRQSMKRLPLATWQHLLRIAGEVDACIKGRKQQDPWQALFNLALAMAGYPLLAEAGAC